VIVSMSLDLVDSKMPEKLCLVLVLVTQVVFEAVPHAGGFCHDLLAWNVGQETDLPAEKRDDPMGDRIFSVNVLVLSDWGDTSRHGAVMKTTLTYHHGDDLDFSHGILDVVHEDQPRMSGALQKCCVQTA